MKKLFISCPMKDRTEAQIRGTMMQMHRIAEAVFGEELEVIQTYIPDPPSGMNQALWCLGESIKMLSEADYFIGVYDEEKAYRGLCNREPGRKDLRHSQLHHQPELCGSGCRRSTGERGS